MTIRNYFIIVYADDDRKELKLVKIEGWGNTTEYDLVSRKEFDWYTLDEGEDPTDFCGSPEDEQDQLEKAAVYARKLAKDNDLKYQPYNKRDGILD